jgi:hypothetical protein
VIIRWNLELQVHVDWNRAFRLTGVSIPMKHLIFAVIAIVSIGVGSASAQSLSHRAPPAQSGNSYNWTAGGGG